MNLTAVTHVMYLGIAVPLTVFVARTLHRHGKRFLLDVFHGDEDLAAAVNSLLVIGWTLVNLGFVGLYLKTTKAIDTASDVTETLSQKVGVIAVVLGAMHLLNVYVFFRMRRRALDRLNPTPPVRPDYTVEAAWIPAPPAPPAPTVGPAFAR